MLASLPPKFHFVSGESQFCRIHLVEHLFLDQSYVTIIPSAYSQVLAAYFLWFFGDFGAQQKKIATLSASSLVSQIFVVFPDAKSSTSVPSQASIKINKFFLCQKVWSVFVNLTPNALEVCNLEMYFNIF